MNKKSYNIPRKQNINACHVFRVFDVKALALLGLAVDNYNCCHKVEKFA